MWVISDELHCEHVGEFNSREEAVIELSRLAKMPWDKPPNVAPCSSWRTCGRNYQLVEFDDSIPEDWRQLQCIPALNVSAEGAEWVLETTKPA